MDMIVTAVNLIGVLSALVIAHELGHFLVAKWCGMNVEDFSLFFGPRLWRIGKFNGTEYNIRSIPLGGFVKIAGMEPDDLILGAAVMRPSLATGKPIVMHGLSEDDIASLNADNIGDRVRAIAESSIAEGERKRLSPEGREELKALLLSTSINEEEHKYLEAILKADAYEPDPRGYNQQPLWKRALTIVAGPFMSFFFGLLIYVVMGFTTGLPYSARTENAISGVKAGGPAQRAGLRGDDRVVSINGTAINDGKGMIEFIHANAGKLLNLQVQRGKTLFAMAVTPELSPDPVEVEENGKIVKKRVGLIGVEAKQVLLFKLYSPMDSAKVGTTAFYRQVTGMLGAIFSKNVARNTGSIIAITSQINRDSKAGIRNVLLTAASLSLSLGIFNLFPIPMLDGGHLVLLAWEGIRRRKLTSREVLTAQLFGFSVIAILFVLVTCKDFIQEILPRLLKHG